REVGIRIPDCAVVQHLSAELGEPLLSSSACEGTSHLWGNHRHSLDFLVAAESMSEMWDGVEQGERMSTVIDLTMDQPILLRQGMGDSSIFEDIIDASQL
ncbi:unnamed protein product, partial [Polarella glacialis]